MLKVWTPWVLTFALVAALPAMAEEKATKKEDPAAKKPAEAKPATPAHAAAGAQVGKPAPDFKGKDMTGKEWKLGDFKGKIVVLEWFNSECPVCARHVKAGTAANVMKKFEKDKDKIAWVAVNSSNFCEEKSKEIGEWVKTNHFDFPILQDAAGTIGKAFGAKTTPHMFVIDQKGNLAYMGAIDDDKDGTKEKKTNYVEQAIDALLKGTAVPTATTEPYGCSVKYKG